MLDAELEEALSQSYKSVGVFGKTFCPEAFFSPFEQLHQQLIAAIDGPHQKVAIAAPRGLGKTTTVRAKCMQQVLYRASHFIPYVSKSESAAMLQTENIKRALRTTPEIRKVFGDIAINDSDPDFDETFSKHAWVAFGSTLILPRGAHQQMRGLVFKHYRPDFIVVDDLEEREELENPEIRRKIKEWFHADLEKCIDRYSNKWKIIYIDTVKHADSLMEELLNSPDWHAVRLDLCDDEYNSRVPNLISTEELRKEVEAHRARGMMDIFYMEYRNMPISREDASFKEEFFRYYDESDLVGRQLENLIIVDPAKTVQMQSADSAIVGVGIDYKSGEWFVRDIIHGKMYPNQLYDEMFAMRRRLRAHAIGIEVTGLEEFIKQPIMNEMMRRGPADAFEPIWLKARGGSEDERGKLRRIGALVPYYRQGYVRHNKSNCAALEAQLLAFPRGKLVDIIDGLAYVVEMLEIGERYFVSPVEDDSVAEPEPDDVDYEPAIAFNWQRI